MKKLILSVLMALSATMLLAQTITVKGTVSGKKVTIDIPEGYKISGNKLEIKPETTTDAKVYGDFYMILGIGEEGDLLNATLTVEGSETLTAVYTPELKNIKYIGSDCAFTAEKGGEYAIVKLGNASSDTSLASLSINGVAITGSMNRPSFTKILNTADVPTVTATASGKRAKVAITQATSVPGTAKIVVTAEDGTQATYTVNFVLAGTDDGEDVPETPSYNGGGSSSGNLFIGSGLGSASGATVTYDHGSSSTEPFCFNDVKSHWAKNDIMAMYNAGIVSGVTATSFEPDRNITRAEFATLVAKALKLPEGDAKFADVNSSDWFASVVASVASAGLMQGDGENFRPNDTITREEMAVIVVKAYEKLGKEIKTGELSFSDKAEISAWAVDYVGSAYATGLIAGMSETEFAPKAPATRAQSASLLSRVIK